MCAPLVDEALPGFVADADRGIGAFAYAGFQPGADAGAFGSVEIAVADVEVRVDDVVVPAFEVCGDVFLHHGVRRAHADL